MMTGHPPDLQRTPATAPGALSEAMRGATREQHDRAERHPLQSALISGTATVGEYVRWLQQLRAVHGELESTFVAQVDRAPHLSTVIDATQFKTRLIDADLLELGPVVMPASVTPATEALVARIHSEVAEHPESLLGFWYVLEGATNGNKFLAKALSQAFGGSSGLSYLDPYGDRLRERWTEWKRRLDQLQLSQADVTRVIDAAKAMFEGLIAVMDSLCAGNPNAAGLSIDGLTSVPTLLPHGLRRETRHGETPK